MKTVCFLFSYSDSFWIKNYLTDRKPAENVIVIAATFEGMILADELQIPYKSHEQTAWRLSKTKLFENALRQSNTWADLSELDDFGLREIRHFQNFPLLPMLQSTLMLSLNEILQAYEFMNNVFTMENPDRVVMSKRADPFEHRNRFYMLTGSNGLEREAVQVVCKNRKIELIELSAPSEPSSVQKKNDDLRKIYGAINNPGRITGKIKKLLKGILLVKREDLIDDIRLKLDSRKKRVLIFTWGGYYLQQIASVFDDLLANNLQVILIILGDQLSDDEIAALQKKGIFVYYKPTYRVRGERRIHNKWRTKCGAVAARLKSSQQLRGFFSGPEAGSYYPLAYKAINRELRMNIPATVTELLRSIRWMDKIEPDLVLAHFSVGTGASDVLPARMRGIPTLALSHGISLSNNSIRDSFSAQYYAIIGQAYKEALIRTQGCFPDILFPVGDIRLHEMKQEDSRQAKIKHGFNPDQPLCIFTDVSGWSQTMEYRHSTYYTVNQILSLKDKIKNIQIVYRVHHGSNYKCMEQYFKKLDLENVYFQVSPKPLFTDVVQAADVVISHHTSAIAEALLSGVRVIYLTALSILEPDYIGYDAIKVADTFEKMSGFVQEILESQMKKDEVIRMAQPFFERILCGNDRMAKDRLAALILELIGKPKIKQKTNFQDWLDRVNRSCKFQWKN